jgi:circadian clock protein KaiC
MARQVKRASRLRTQLAKSPTGIQGLDEITGGGLPKGRSTLVCGGAGCGKTLLAMEYLVRGATRFGEPGVFMAFEETVKDLTENVASLGFDLKSLIASRKIAMDFVSIEPNEVEESGDYDLEGLFIRLSVAIDAIGAKRVVLDTVESLFAALNNPFILRGELRRLFRWLKQKGVTSIVTAERGEGTLTRMGIEEYVSDCVIMLDHRVSEQISARRLRVVKYRGSTHGTNEFPFLIDEDGMSVLPVTSLGLAHTVSTERVSTGIARLDAMLGGAGYYRGSSVLLSGTAGTGKTSIAAHFVEAACRRGERALYFAFEESAGQITRNMQSIGIDLASWVEKGGLQFHAARPTLTGLEMHLATMHKAVSVFKPQIVVVDPVNSFLSGGAQVDISMMLLRLLDLLKTHQITGLFTSLTAGGRALEHTDVAISSLTDTWLLLRDQEANGERNRLLYVLKSRGMAHSNQVREFLLTDHGVDLRDVYLGPGGVLTGSARLAQEAQEEAARLARQQEIDQCRLELERKRSALKTQVAALRAEFAATEAETVRSIEQGKQREARLAQDRSHMGQNRHADPKGKGRSR